jgi:predicted type IV restriction endonuclease
MVVGELHEIVEQVRRKITRYGKSGVNEQNTKSTLIQPLLRVLGWDVEDLEDVHLEYRQKSKDKPVDYALLLLRSPCLFFEAKSLGESLDDRKWANQVMGYASVAGVEWVVLTDGDEYRIYNSHATVPVDEKLFRKIRITDESTLPEKTLSLLSKEQMQERQINRLWDAHFVDRQVQSALQKLIATDHEPDAALVRLLNKRITNLSASDIRAGLRRLEVEITCPLTDELKSPSKTILSSARVKKHKAKEKSKAHVGVSLSDLLHAGLLSAPAKLFRKYKGTQLEATLKHNGTVEFQGQVYATCSSAAEHARGTVIGGKPSTNGWVFWKFRTRDGRIVLLDEPRQAFLKRNSN